MRTARLAALATGLWIALIVPVGSGFSSAPAAESPPFQQVLQTDASLNDPRLGLTFQVPVMTIARIRPRGNFFEVELTPSNGEAFFVYSTTFRIRRPAGLEIPGEISGPCAPPEIPKADRFDVSAVCDGTIGLNKIRRTVRIIREDQLLHLFHLAHRVEDAELTDRILQSVRVNSEFRALAVPADAESTASP